MAYAASLTPPAGLGGVLAYSGRLLDDVPAQLAPAGQLRGLRFLVSHGRHDPVLPINHAQQAVTFLRQQQLRVDYQPFAGGHELPPDYAAGARRWLYALPLR